MHSYLQKIIKVSLVFIVCISCNNTSKKIDKNSGLKPIIERLSNQGNWKEAIDLAKIELKELSNDNNQYYYLVLGQNNRFMEEYNLSEINFKNVLKNSKEQINSEYIGEAYYGLGDLNYLKWSYFKQNEALSISKAYLDSAMIYAKKGEHLKLESKILYRLGTIFQIQENKKESLKSFEKGLKISFSISDTIGIIRNDIHKAAELEKNGKLDSALFHYNRAYNYGKLINRNYSEAHSLCNLGLYYFDIGNILKAKDYFTKAKFLSEELGHRIIMCRSYYGLSQVEKKIGNNENAKKYAAKGLQLATEKGYQNYIQAFKNLITNIKDNID